MAIDAWPVTGQTIGAAVEEQLSALFDVHYLRLCRLAVVLLGDPARAEDAVQEAFLRTFAGWGRIRQPEMAHVYLRRAVLNQCHSGLRRRVTEWRANSAVTASRGEPRTDGFEAGRAQHLDVVDAVRRLPARQRDTVVLRYYLDLSEAEIAETLGVHPGTVKSQLAKARATLSRNVVLSAGGGDD